MKRFIVLAALALAAAIAHAQPLGTGFTFQGRLFGSDGYTVGGVYDMKFALYDSVSGGFQLGPTLCVENLSVSDGLVVVQLDFGNLFDQQRYLEVQIRVDHGQDCSNDAGFATLSPRQTLFASPNAIYSLNAANALTANNATNASLFGNQPPSFYRNASNLTGVIPSNLLFGNYTASVTFSNTNNSFNGNGSNLVQLNATSLAFGTVNDTRLSTNVALLTGAQIFTGAKTFTAPAAFTAAAGTAPFSVTSQTRVTNLNADFFDGLDSAAYAQLATPNAFINAQTITTTSATALFSQSTAATGTTYGGRFSSASATGFGVLAENTGGGVGLSATTTGGQPAIRALTTGNGQAGQFSINNSASSASTIFADTNGAGKALEVQTTGTGNALQVRTTSASNPNASLDARTAGPGNAVFAQSAGSDAIQGVTTAPNKSGVLGTTTTANANGGYFNSAATTGTGNGVVGQCNAGSTGYAVYALGNTAATGTKSFHIDHPLDPATKYLNHYCAEGPEPLNVYRGSITCDERGEATVQLPDYYGAINKDPHYQLTCVGGFAPIYVADEVTENHFRIAGGSPGLKVCWTVTATRNDAWVRAHGAPVEVEKEAEVKGRYIQPELFGQPRSAAIFQPSAPAPPDGAPALQVH
jgi:hypothetical protein